MYRIITKPGVLAILFAGTKKECVAIIQSFKKEYPQCIIEKVDNTFSYAMKYC